MEKLYVEQELSLQDIADLYGCTRVLVYFLMRDYGIPRRSHSTARRIAQRAGKVQYTVQLASGGSRRIKQQGTNINERFFREWSPEMAYVLGVFYSDGCLCVKPNGYHSASISQKEPELLEKCLALMNCDARLQYGHQRDNSAIYSFYINDQDVCRDLVGHGLHPRKSRSIQFPDMPPELIRHFIRGCWDGDGSISKGKRPGSRWVASYVTSSFAFISSLHDALVVLGMAPATICSWGQPGAFYLRWSGPKCSKLFQILYDGVPRAQYLTRKYVRFRLAAESLGPC